MRSRTKWNRPPRGSTLIEVMVASTVLVIGMTGIIALLLKGMTTHREANVQQRAMNYSSSIASQYESVDYTALTAGVIDGGIWLDEDSRKYPVTTTITAVGDGGVGAWRVEVKTTWINGFRQPVDAVAVTIVSEVPDAGY